MLVAGGCGGARPTSPPSESPLLSGGRAVLPGAAPRAAAAHLATRFARAYARGAYRRRPPRLPAGTEAVTRALAGAAGRVPPARRRLHPRLLALRLRPFGRRALHASARIGDGRFPPFSVSFALSPRRGRWFVTSISLPD